MAEQTTVNTTAPAEDTTAAAASAVDFAPQISTHPVATLTLGRQSFNDSDKSNYFEG